MKKFNLEKVIKYILGLTIVYFSFLPIISVLISGFNKYILSKNNIDVLIRPMIHLRNSLLIISWLVLLSLIGYWTKSPYLVIVMGSLTLPILLKLIGVWL